jgi:hypothetical protein
MFGNPPEEVLTMVAIGAAKRNRCFDERPYITAGE